MHACPPLGLAEDIQGCNTLCGASLTGVRFWFGQKGPCFASSRSQEGPRGRGQCHPRLPFSRRTGLAAWHKLGQPCEQTASRHPEGHWQNKRSAKGCGLSLVYALLPRAGHFTPPCNASTPSTTTKSDTPLTPRPPRPPTQQRPGKGWPFRHPPKRRTKAEPLLERPASVPLVRPPTLHTPTQ